MKITDYKIVFPTNNEDMELRVNHSLSEGWQPYGSPYVDRNGKEKQAMVKYEEKAPVKRGKKDDA